MKQKEKKDYLTEQPSQSAMPCKQHLNQETGMRIGGKGGELGAAELQHVTVIYLLCFCYSLLSYFTGCETEVQIFFSEP